MKTTQADRTQPFQKERSRLKEQRGNLAFIHRELSKLYRVTKRSEILSVLNAKELLSYRQIAMKLLGLSGAIDTQEILDALESHIANMDKLIEKAT